MHSKKRVQLTVGGMAEHGCSEVDTSPKTGFVYDGRLTSHFCAWNKDFTERPERIEGCYFRIQELGLVSRCRHVPVRPASDEEVRLCHTDKHIELLKKTKTMTTEELSHMSQSYDYIYFHKNVDENARLAVGGAIDLMDQIMSGKLQNGMAFIRPPGHHAMAEEFSGYCYFNNIAITTHIALKKYNLERILIVDWDVHHGQGTQFAFYDDPRVLFFSIHRFEHGEEWPHLRESDYDYIGQGKGKGFNVNVPLNEIGCDNSDYLAIMFNVLLPLAYEFQPQLVLVSAGYDSAVGCPEGQMTVTPACFAHFVNLLKTLAGGKIVLLLEGGYCVRTLAEASALSLRALLGDPTPNISPITGARKSVVESVLNVIKMHRAVHPSLAFQDTQQEGKEVGHSWQTYVPPEHNIQCRTKYNRPEQFPLMQECFDEVSDAVQQQINQRIEQLERDTILSRPAHRTGFLYYQDLHQNGKNGSFRKCSREEVDSQVVRAPTFEVPVTHDDNKNSMEACVSSAIDAILENTVGSCILLPCGTYSEGTTQDLCYTFANALEACIHKNSQIKRTLVLNLAVGEDGPLLTSFAGTKSCMVVLSVGLSPVEKRAKDPSWRHIIQVPLTTSQMKNGDLISVGLQVLLPIAYEFAPDLVVFCLGSSEKKISAEGQTDLTCMAHLLTMLNGLARGRMLLFVKPSAEVQEFGVVMDCISALLGDPLSILQPCLPQQSTVEVIKTLQDKYKSSWRTLQFREKLPSPRQTLEESV